MTGRLTSNTDEVSEMGGAGVENLSLVLRSIYIRYYGNVTPNYEDSMERQDGMVQLCVFFFVDVLSPLFAAHTTKILHLTEIRERECERKTAQPLILHM